MPSSTLRVIEIDPNTDDRWDEFLKCVPESLVYHHSAWLQVLKEAYGCGLINLACEGDDGRLWGILPLSLKRGLLTGRVFSSLYGTPVAGPLALNRNALEILMRAAMECARGRPDTPLELKVSSNALDHIIPHITGVPIDTTYVLDLPERVEVLRFGKAHNRARIRSAISKASRMGVQIRFAETDRDLWNWYGLYLETMCRLGALPQSYQFFKSAWSRLRPEGLMKLLIAEHSQESRKRLIGGLVLLTFGQTVHYAYNGWSWENQSLRANDALHWEAIQYACGKGYRRYDLGGGSQGLAEYKTKWGAQPKPIYTYRYCTTSGLTKGTSKSSGSSLKSTLDIHARESPVRQFALSILRRLPSGAVATLSKWAHQI